MGEMADDAEAWERTHPPRDRRRAAHCGGEWVTGAGVRLRPRDMSTAHLVSAINMSISRGWHRRRVFRDMADELAGRM